MQPLAAADILSGDRCPVLQALRLRHGPLQGGNQEGCVAGAARLEVSAHVQDLETAGQKERCFAQKTSQRDAFFCVSDPLRVWYCSLAQHRPGNARDLAFYLSLSSMVIPFVRGVPAGGCCSYT